MVKHETSIHSHWTGGTVQSRTPNSTTKTWAATGTTGWDGSSEGGEQKAESGTWWRSTSDTSLRNAKEYSG